MKRPGDFTENLANSMRIPGVTLGISCELVFLRTWEVTFCCYMLILLHSRMNKPKMERCMHGTLLLASSVIIYHQYRSLTVLITAKITIAQSVEYSTGRFMRFGSFSWPVHSGRYFCCPNCFIPGHSRRLYSKPNDWEQTYFFVVVSIAIYKSVLASVNWSCVHHTIMSWRLLYRCRVYLGFPSLFLHCKFFHTT